MLGIDTSQAVKKHAAVSKFPPYSWSL